jgi:hypothetical protein
LLFSPSSTITRSETSRKAQFLRTIVVSKHEDHPNPIKRPGWWPGLCAQRSTTNIYVGTRRSSSSTSAKKRRYEFCVFYSRGPAVCAPRTHRISKNRVIRAGARRDSGCRHLRRPDEGTPMCTGYYRLWSCAHTTHIFTDLCPENRAKKPCLPLRGVQEETLQCPDCRNKTTGGYNR